MLAKIIFLSAIEIESPNERDDFVRQQCGGNERLRRQVLSLLVAHDLPNTVVDHPAVKLNVSD
ncbi:MAG: hypothetical protein KDB23_33915, partial [Planctomycetales bacterium]|nr:hypothetical protein [Planctomycetales bacterium]